MHATPHARLRAILLAALGASIGCDPAEGKDDGHRPLSARWVRRLRWLRRLRRLLPDHWETCDPAVPDLTRDMIDEGYAEAARLCDSLEAWGGDCPAGEDFPATSVMYDQFELDESGIGWDAWVTCGPDTNTPDACCYVVSVSMWGEGRPFRVGGTARLAQGGPAAGWCADLDVDATVPAPLVRAWEERGLAEHASVAAFSRFALQLLQLGAPAELLAATTRAMAEEVEHARLAFGVAAQVSGGEARGPGPLDVTGALDGALSPRQILEDLLVEGCIGETLAASEASEEARLCRDPAVRSVLTTIAREEAATRPCPGARPDGSSPGTPSSRPWPRPSSPSRCPPPPSAPPSCPRPCPTPGAC